MDHAQKTCYHCNRKGHIKANCPARKRLDAKPWTKRPGPREKKTTVHKGFGMGRGRGKSFSSRSGPSKKKIYWERTIHPTVRGGFLVRAGPNEGSTSATLNALEPDTGDNSPRESLTVTRLQRDNFDFPWAIYMQAKTGHETPGNVKRLRNDQRTKEIIKAGREFRLESINTNQVARVNKATIRSELSSMRWHTEMPADQEKAGETPHTLHERRPQNNKETQ